MTIRHRTPGITYIPEPRRLHAITHTSPAGASRQNTTSSKARRDILAALERDVPPQDPRSPATC